MAVGYRTAGAGERPAKPPLSGGEIGGDAFDFFAGFDHVFDGVPGFVGIQLQPLEHRIRNRFKRCIADTVQGRSYWSQNRELWLLAITYNILLL